MMVVSSFSELCATSGICSVAGVCYMQSLVLCHNGSDYLVLWYFKYFIYLLWDNTQESWWGMIRFVYICCFAAKPLSARCDFHGRQETNYSSSVSIKNMLCNGILFVDSEPLLDMFHHNYLYSPLYSRSIAHVVASTLSFRSILLQGTMWKYYLGGIDMEKFRGIYL